MQTDIGTVFCPLVNDISHETPCVPSTASLQYQTSHFAPLTSAPDFGPQVPSNLDLSTSSDLLFYSTQSETLHDSVKLYDNSNALLCTDQSDLITQHVQLLSEKAVAVERGSRACLPESTNGEHHFSTTNRLQTGFLHLHEENSKSSAQVVPEGGSSGEGFCPMESVSLPNNENEEIHDIL